MKDERALEMARDRHPRAEMLNLRNMHADGTDNLRPNVGLSFDIVRELINQLFEQHAGQE